MKKYKYRKVTPKDKELMQKYRNQGMSYKQIGKAFGVTLSTVQYHVGPEGRYRKSAIKRANEYTKRRTKKQIERDKKRKKKYLKTYMLERYHNDEEFRKRFTNHISKSQKKCRDKRRNKGLCPKCGGKREDKNYVTCALCREKGRKIYYK